MDRRTFLSLVPVSLLGGLFSARDAGADVATSQLFAGTIRSLKECYSPSEALRYISWAAPGPAIVKPLQTFADKADATFRVVPGLSDSRFVSFEFIRRPGYYLVTQPSQGLIAQVHRSLFAGRLVNAETFRLEATFDVRPGSLGASSYRIESVAARPAVVAPYWLESSPRPEVTQVLVGPPSTWVYYGPGRDCSSCDHSLADFSNFVFTRPHMASFSFRSKNFPDRYMRHRNFLGELTQVAPIDELDATFIVIPGLADKRMISLEAKNFPGLYLRHQSMRMRLSMLRDLGDGNDATFRLVDALDPSGIGWISLESRNFPGYYVRHRNFQLWLDRNDGTPLFRADASFEMAEPKAR